MACNTPLTPITRDCTSFVTAGGLIKFYIAPATFVTGITASTGTVSAITMSAGTKFVEFEFNKTNATYKETSPFDKAIGATSWTTQITLNLPKREVAKRNALAMIGSGRPLKIILQDSNLSYKLCGWISNAILINNDGGSGDVKNSNNGYTLTFEAEETEEMPEINSAIIAALIA